MIIKRIIIIFLLISLYIILASTSAWALIYVWYDKEGNAHFSNIRPPAWIKNYEVREYKPGPALEGAKGTEGAKATDVAKAIEVPYKKSDGVISVRAIFNGTEGADVLIDTGAAFTVIARSLADKLNLQIKRQGPEVILTTKDAPVRAPLAVIGSIKLGEAELKDVQVAVWEMAPFSKDPSVSGLLGSNFLHAFKVVIDPAKDKIILQKR